MEILINIICGDDTYDVWYYAYTDSPIEGEEEIVSIPPYNDKLILYNDKLLRYNDELIRDIQGMYLYKYLKKLYVYHGQPEIIMSFDNYTFMSNNIENIAVEKTRQIMNINNKLEKLCDELLMGIGNCLPIILWE